MRSSEDSLGFLWKSIAFIALFFCLIKSAYPQVSPGSENSNFQYLTGVLTSSQSTSNVAKAWNSIFPPKYYSLYVGGTTANPFAVAIEGSLDNTNWSTLGVTTTTSGVLSISSPKPMIYFRLHATTINAADSITATAIGSP